MAMDIALSRVGLNRTFLLLLVSTGAPVLPAHSCKAVTPQEVSFPSELRGAWDLSDDKCRAIDTHESDSRIEIGARVLQGYEHAESLISIRKISEAPLVWRVISISNIAPPEIQGDAVFYVLGGDRLTISDGESTKVYVRCGVA